MVIYPDGHYKCFGCGASGKTVTLDLDIREIPQFTSRWKHKENIASSITKIKSLPVKDIRGLQLHYDKDYYYVLWEDGSYYKKREWKDTNCKYRCPVGHFKPLMVLNKSSTKDLCFIVEGEINALTLQRCGIDNPILSPGSATEFLKKYYVEQYLKYDKFCIIVDKDAAGVCAGIETKAMLERSGKLVTLYPMDKDLNYLYTQHGAKEIHNQISTAMALFRVRRD